MAFLDQISKNLAGYGKEAAKKAKDTAEIFQLKAEIRGEKQKINELYAAIGAVYFKNHRDESEDEYKMFFPEIENAMEHIAELEEKLKQLDNTEKCPGKKRGRFLQQMWSSSSSGRGDSRER